LQKLFHFSDNRGSKFSKALLISSFIKGKSVRFAPKPAQTTGCATPIQGVKRLVRHSGRAAAILLDGR
jgi:hypothetical protein